MSLRWYVKKAARSSVALGTFGTGGTLAGKLLSPGPRVRALTYHRFGVEPRDAFCVDPAAFDEQMAWLAGQGRAASLEDVDEFVRGRRVLRDGSVLVTIDDGCISTLEIALPILARHRVPAVAFVTSSLIGLGALGLPERYMSWAELRACAEAGLTIGSHAFSHRSLGQMPIAEARDEARRSREQLQAELGRDVIAFAYPFGTRGDYSARTEDALAEAGYRIAFHSQHGAIRAGMPLLSLPRVKVEGGEGLWMFRLLVEGAMDPWRVVDENLWRLQRVRREITRDTHPSAKSPES